MGSNPKLLEKKINYLSLRFYCMVMQYRLVPVGSFTVDRIVKHGKTIGYHPGGIANLCRTWVKLIEPNAITPVSKIGDDRYVKYVEKPLNRLHIDESYILKIKDAESRLYEIDVTNPQRPKIQRKQSADKLMSTVPKDIIPILSETAILFYQSFATVFETPYLDLTLKTIEEAYRLGIPVGLDNNIRQASVKNLKTMSDITQKVFGKLNFLKVNEGEAKIIMNPDIDEPIEKITLQENELSRVANEIVNTYSIKTVAITMGERGSFILTRDEELRFEAVKPENFVNSLGAGDLWCAGLCMKYPRKLSNEEAGFLATVLGSLAAEGISAYPSHLTKKKIKETICNNSELYRVNSNQLLRKLKL